MKSALRIAFIAALVVFSASASFAQTAEVVNYKASAGGWAMFLGAGLAIGIAGLGAALGMGRAVGSGLEGISRNPGAYNKIFTPMILGLAFLETIAIYALVVALILLFVI